MINSPFAHEQLKAVGCQWIGGDPERQMRHLLTGRVRVPGAVEVSS